MLFANFNQDFTSVITPCRNLCMPYSLLQMYFSWDT